MDQGRNTGKNTDRKNIEGVKGTSGDHNPNTRKPDLTERAWKEADLRIKLQEIQATPFGGQSIDEISSATHTGSEGINTNTDDNKLDDHGVLEPSRPRVKRLLELIMHKDLSMAKKFVDILLVLYNRSGETQPTQEELREKWSTIQERLTQFMKSEDFNYLDFGRKDIYRERVEKQLTSTQAHLDGMGKNDKHGVHAFERSVVELIALHESLFRQIEADKRSAVIMQWLHVPSSLETLRKNPNYYNIPRGNFDHYNAQYNEILEKGVNAMHEHVHIPDVESEDAIKAVSVIEESLNKFNQLSGEVRNDMEKYEKFHKEYEAFKDTYIQIKDHIDEMVFNANEKIEEPNKHVQILYGLLVNGYENYSSPLLERLEQQSPSQLSDLKKATKTLGNAIKKYMFSEKKEKDASKDLDDAIMQKVVEADSECRTVLQHHRTYQQVLYDQMSAIQTPQGAVSRFVEGVNRTIQDVVKGKAYPFSRYIRGIDLEPTEIPPEKASESLSEEIQNVFDQCFRERKLYSGMIVDRGSFWCGDVSLVQWVQDTNKSLNRINEFMGYVRERLTIEERDNRPLAE
ncbi:MAG TPA: hypothetical protein VK553_04410 [Candidatus Nitrosopolaris rasttigaisensis]|nr:hypothetical protein [Candidatus Nitrosopolaris rasttigaisensis]